MDLVSINEFLPLYALKTNACRLRAEILECYAYRIKMDAKTLQYGQVLGDRD